MANAEDKNIRYKEKRQPAKEAALSVDRTRNLPELLAPAGEAAAVYAAFSAGADAVYLGASQFSARAYAKNLSEDELVSAIDHAHLFGKKIYLACNILLRGSEFEALKQILDPLYEYGLDGVIVQDLGVVRFLRERYLKLPLHGSTQMSVNSMEGAIQLKKLGISRLVPGRELSLKEIKSLKEAGLEIECFVHGAMCYSYSGRCLLSSMAGGRSGNRGRCAGPCRQPYSCPGSNESAYYLSMKDMMALKSLPELIEAGVDSFKIEGRMKAPEYSAGVSAVYRKYMELYAKGKPYRIEESDIKILEGLYMRSERQEGYLHKHNGRDMISLDDPSYSKVSEEEKERIRLTYGEHPLKKETDATVYINAGKEAVLELGCEETKVTVSGAVVQEAVKRSISDAEIEKQLTKTGDTDFVIRDMATVNDGCSFIAVSALNELRRSALFRLRSQLITKREPAVIMPAAASVPVRNEAPPEMIAGFSGRADISSAAANDIINGIILELDAFLEEPDKYIYASCGKKLYIRLPGIIRQKDAGRLKEKLLRLRGYDIAGIYCSGIDALGAALSCTEGIELKGDRGLYVFNPYAEEEALGLLSSYTLSEEFSSHDINSAIRKDAAELIIYGRTPLMYSANCIINTKSVCDRNAQWQLIKDEKHHAFPVRPVHEYCYNVLYNCLPTSLHKQINDIRMGSGLKALRIEFTDESPALQGRITDAFAALIKGEDTVFPLAAGAYTYGHYKRGAE